MSAKVALLPQGELRKSTEFFSVASPRGANDANPDTSDDEMLPAGDPRTRSVSPSHQHCRRRKNTVDEEEQIRDALLEDNHELTSRIVEMESKSHDLQRTLVRTNVELEALRERLAERDVQIEMLKIQVRSDVRPGEKGSFQKPVAIEEAEDTEGYGQVGDKLNESRRASLEAQTNALAFQDRLDEAERRNSQSEETIREMLETQRDIEAVCDEDRQNMQQKISQLEAEACDMREERTQMCLACDEERQNMQQKISELESQVETMTMEQISQDEGERRVSGNLLSEIAPSENWPWERDLLQKKLRKSEERCRRLTDVAALGADVVRKWKEIQKISTPR